MNNIYLDENNNIVYKIVNELTKTVGYYTTSVDGSKGSVLNLNPFEGDTSKLRKIVDNSVEVVKNDIMNEVLTILDNKYNNSVTSMTMSIDADNDTRIEAFAEHNTNIVKFELYKNSAQLYRMLFSGVRENSYIIIPSLFVKTEGYIRGESALENIGGKSLMNGLQVYTYKKPGSKYVNFVIPTLTSTQLSKNIYLRVDLIPKYGDTVSLTSEL